MANDRLPPERLASVFAEFVQQVAAAAKSESSPLLDKIANHLGTDPAQLPVTLEQFDTFDQPNLQVAMDAYLKEGGRSAELIGVSMQNKRFMAIGLSELITRGPVFGHGPLVEGPVDYVNHHLANDAVLPCVQFGMYLITAGPSRATCFHVGGSAANPRSPLRHLGGGRPFLAGTQRSLHRCTTRGGRGC